MKRFVFTFRVVPPHLETFLARSGGSVFDAAYSKTLNRFYMVVPGGTLENIAAPEMIFLEEEYARTHPREFVAPPAKIRSRHSKRPMQLSLSF